MAVAINKDAIRLFMNFIVFPYTASNDEDALVVFIIYKFIIQI